MSDYSGPEFNWFGGTENHPELQGLYREYMEAWTTEELKAVMLIVADWWEDRGCLERAEAIRQYWGLITYC